MSFISINSELGPNPLRNPVKHRRGRLTWSEKNQEGRRRAYEDESLGESDNLPDPGVLAQEIVEDLEAALEQFRLIAEDLRQQKETHRDR